MCKEDLAKIAEFLYNKIHEMMKINENDPELEQLREDLRLIMFNIGEIERSEGNERLFLRRESLWGKKKKIGNIECYELLNQPVMDDRFNIGDLIIYNEDPEKIKLLNSEN